MSSRGHTWCYELYVERQDLVSVLAGKKTCQLCCAEGEHNGVNDCKHGAVVMWALQWLLSASLVSRETIESQRLLCSQLFLQIKPGISARQSHGFYEHNNSYFKRKTLYQHWYNYHGAEHTSPVSQLRHLSDPLATINVLYLALTAYVNIHNTTNPHNKDYTS